MFYLSLIGIAVVIGIMFYVDCIREDKATERRIENSVQIENEMLDRAEARYGVTILRDEFWPMTRVDLFKRHNFSTVRPHCVRYSLNAFPDKLYMARYDIKGGELIIYRNGEELDRIAPEKFSEI